MPGIKVYGGSVDNVKGCTNKVENGDKLSLGEDIKILSLHTPWYVYLFLVNFNIHRIPRHNHSIRDWHKYMTTDSRVTKCAFHGLGLPVRCMFIWCCVSMCFRGYPINYMLHLQSWSSYLFLLLSIKCGLLLFQPH